MTTLMHSAWKRNMSNSTHGYFLSSCHISLDQTICTLSVVIYKNLNENRVTAKPQQSVTSQRYLLGVEKILYHYFVLLLHFILVGYVKVPGLRCGFPGGNVTLLWVFDGDVEADRTQWLKGSPLDGEIMAAYQDGFQAAPGWEDKVAYSPGPGYPGTLTLVDFTSADSGNYSLYVQTSEYLPNEDAEIREFTGQWNIEQYVLLFLIYKNILSFIYNIIIQPFL